MMQGWLKMRVKFSVRNFLKVEGLVEGGSGWSGRLRLRILKSFSIGSVIWREVGD